MELLKMIFADSSGMLPEMKLSDDNAVFVTKNRIIRRLSAQGPCVIIGCLADFLLKQNLHCFRVFVYSDIEIRHQPDFPQIRPPRAESRRGNQPNKQETGQPLLALHRTTVGRHQQLRLVVNISRISIDKTVEIIRSAI